MTNFCELTSKDHAILEVMHERSSALGEPIAPMLREKLAGARVVLRDEVHPDVVTLNSRVLFNVDGGVKQTRIVVQGELRALVGMTIPLATPLGIALLGLSPGQAATIERADGTLETVHLERVLYQPEAAKRGMLQGKAAMAANNGSSPRFPRLVYSSDGPVLNVSLQPDATRGYDDDGPGPSAA
jgi:regulator of nucleoside diphosphate kinase